MFCTSGKISPNVVTLLAIDFQMRGCVEEEPETDPQRPEGVPERVGEKLSKV